MVKSNFLLFIIVYFFICLFTLSCAIDKNKPACSEIPSIQVIDDSLSLEDACAKISLSVLSHLGTIDTNRVIIFSRMLDTTADSLKRVLENNAKSLAGKQAILDVVYNQWKMGFDPQDDNIKTVLPHCAFKARKGNCMGVSLMILMLAERLGCPIYGVVLPGHFFCRYDDGAAMVNIEPNKGGFSHPDGYYRTKYLSKNDSWYRLEKLSKIETIGVFYYTIGTLFLNRNDPGFTVALLQESCRCFSSLVEAKGNYALALALCGKRDLAMNIFKELFETNPSLVNLAANYGAVALSAGRYEQAFQIYKKGLAYFPDDPKLLIGLSQAYVARSKKDSNRTDAK